MARRAETIILTVQEREKLEAWQRRTTISAGVARRAQAILLLAAGKTQGETAKIVGMGRRMVRKLGRRFIKKRIRGLEDKQRPGRPPVFFPRGGDASGEDCLRDARSPWSVTVAMGL